MSVAILSVVVPCYNEQEVLPETCRRLEALLRRLIESKIHVTQFREVQTDLEEAFMSFARPQDKSPKASADGVTSHA